MKSLFLNQIIGLIKKTITVKKKKRIETFMELLYGIQYIIILVIIHVSTQGLQPHTVYGTNYNQQFSNIPVPIIPYISSNLNTSSIIIDKISSQYPDIKFIEFQNEDTLLEAYSNLTLVAGVQFNEVDLQADSFNYTLLTSDIFSQFDSGYSTQLEIELLSAFTSLKSELALSSNIITVAFPYISQIFNISSILFIIYFPLFFLYSLQQLIILIVTEKKDKIKEALKVMGMYESAYWLSNIIVQCSMNIILIVLMEIIAVSSGIFSYTSPVMIFMMFLMFSLTLIGIAFLLATFIENPKTAGGVSSIFLLIGVSVSAFWQFYLKTRVSINLKYLVFLLSPAAFGEFLNSLSNCEANKIPILWSSSEFTVPMGFMILDFILYSMISWYSIQVYQGDTGTSKGYFFFLRKDYWFQPKEKTYSDEDDEKKSILINDHENDFITNQSGIVIKNLCKEYKSAEKSVEKVKAVNDLSLSIKKDTIFALLGKNGAGKSTTISMLTGLLPPTSGDAYIMGYSMNNQMDIIRKHIGLCPQHNILYQQLTCSEHIQLFARIKGIEESEIPKLISQSLTEVGLSDKIDAVSSTLSGGQKRRLCLAIAFIGNPSLVFLDEVSSGLDPYARHQIWKLLQQKKIGRTIVLTTHFMEEAEVLGETIAIMTKGKIHCMGSVMELKNKFGLGYTLVISFDNNLKQQQQQNNKGGSTVQIGFEKYLYSRFPDVKPLNLNYSNILSNKEDLELSYSLSLQSSETLSKFFQDLEPQESDFHIKRISLNIKTLEEIFLKINDDEFSN